VVHMYVPTQSLRRSPAQSRCVRGVAAAAVPHVMDSIEYGVGPRMRCTGQQFGDTCAALSDKVALREIRWVCCGRTMRLAPQSVAAQTETILVFVCAGCRTSAFRRKTLPVRSIFYPH
jgi:hypothetical protein